MEGVGLQATEQGRARDARLNKPAHLAGARGVEKRAETAQTFIQRIAYAPRRSARAQLACVLSRMFSESLSVFNTLHLCRHVQCHMMRADVRQPVHRPACRAFPKATLAAAVCHPLSCGMLMNVPPASALLQRDLLPSSTLALGKRASVLGSDVTHARLVGACVYFRILRRSSASNFAAGPLICQGRRSESIGWYIFDARGHTLGYLASPCH